MPKGNTVSSLNGKMKIKEYPFEGPRTGGGNVQNMILNIPKANFIKEYRYECTIFT